MTGGHEAEQDRATPLLTLAQGDESEEKAEVTDSSKPRTAWGRLGMLSVTMVIFFNVSGGPLGSEEVISSTGPLPGMCLMLAFAMCFSIPQAMITAEVRQNSINQLPD